jgi:hypothetical protein
MFGSLVVVFPTPHEGGNLILRHRGEEWTFDATEVSPDAEAPAIAYIAFYSNVDHEVTEVMSGYRVTLTYNLYLESKSPSEDLPPSVDPVAPCDLVFKTALSNALLNPSFLPDGGVLGFGLSFMYPIKVGYRATPLKDLLGRLKGSDAVIKRVCDQLSLTVALKAIYVDKEVEVGNKIITHHIMVDEIIDLSGYQIDDLMTTFLRGDDEHNGKVIYDAGTKPPMDWNKKPVKASQAVGVLWVTPLTEYAHFKSDYIAYGNDASLGHIYGNVCLVVKVGPFGQRDLEISGLQQEKDDSDGSSRGDDFDDDSDDLQDDGEFE